MNSDLKIWSFAGTPADTSRPVATRPAVRTIRIEFPIMTSVSLSGSQVDWRIARRARRSRPVWRKPVPERLIAFAGRQQTANRQVGQSRGMRAPRHGRNRADPNEHIVRPGLAPGTWTCFEVGLPVA